MPDVASFTVKPPLRCYGQRRDRPGLPCGERACWMRASVNGSEPAFFCDHCRQPTDEPIPADPMFRRLTFTIDVLFAATSLLDRTAKAEAYARLEQAVQAVGGLLNLHAVASVVGRYNPPPPQGKATGKRGSVG